jgi:pimeloyl-ACP methyl ester carboxylesterase
MTHLETFVPVPGARLFAVADGDGPPILLLHAGIADLRSWDALVPLLTETGYRAIRFDMRGFGLSTTEDVEFSRGADVVAVLDSLGVDRVACVGNSIGGKTALEVALEHPDRVVALVLVASGIGGFDGGETPEERAFEVEFVAAEAAGDADRLADLDVRLWVDGVGQPATRVDPAIRELVREMDRPSCEPTHVGGRPIPLDPPAVARLGEVRVPTLAIAGELDTVGTRAVVDKIVDEVPDALGLTLPDVAHMIGMEQPEVLAGLILDHLAPLPRWS